MARAQGAELSLIKKIELLAAKKPGAVSLAQGIPSFDTPEPIKRRVAEALAKGLVARYSLTPGMIELREAIEDNLGQQGMHYDFENEIIVTVGSIEAITATLLATVGSGDEVIIATPSYVSYKESVRLAGAEPVFVALDEERGWAVDIAAFERALSEKTKAIILCNPNNPTGTIFHKQELLQLGALAKQKNLVLILDEVYRDFLYQEEDRQHYFSLAMESQFRDHVVRVFSFSKAFAMTGWRVGYLHTAKHLAERILKVHDTLVTCAPVISQYAALAALEMKPQEWFLYREEYQQRRDLMCRNLSELKEYFSYAHPQSSYFVFPKLAKERFPEYTSSYDLALDILEKVGLAVVPGMAFGPSGEDHLRLSFGRSREDITEGMTRLKKYCHAL